MTFVDRAAKHAAPTMQIKHLANQGRRIILLLVQGSVPFTLVALVAWW